METSRICMKWTMALAMPLIFTSHLVAQTPQEDFKQDITLSASNYVAYRGLRRN